MKIIRFFPLRAVLAVFLCVLAAPPAAATEEPATEAILAGTVERLSSTDRQKIRRVINLQLKAFERNQEALAFSYSTPETRRYFGSSHSFMELVRSEYPVLVRHVSREFLEAAIIDGEVIQPLRIVTHEGEIIVALYSLARQPDREWRISGCELAPSSLQAT